MVSSSTKHSGHGTAIGQGHEITRNTDAGEALMQNMYSVRCCESVMSVSASLVAFGRHISTSSRNEDIGCPSASSSRGSVTQASLKLSLFEVPSSLIKTRALNLCPSRPLAATRSAALCFINAIIMHHNACTYPPYQPASPQ